MQITISLNVDAIVSEYGLSEFIGSRDLPLNREEAIRKIEAEIRKNWQDYVDLDSAVYIEAHLPRDEWDDFHQAVVEAEEEVQRQVDYRLAAERDPTVKWQQRVRERRLGIAAYVQPGGH